MIEFRTTIQRAGKNATGIQVPDEVVLALGAGRRPAVHVTLGSYAYRSTIASMGGRFMIPVSAEVRAAAGVEGGDEVVVALALDTEPRVVEMPADLAAALVAAPAAQAAFERLSYSHRRAHVLAIEGAKAAETRARRVAKIVADLGG
jgi:antitoxin component of MazEF toxin-antitoxin module